jgi:uncharacterized protein YbjT (DUF2867 family)
MNTKVVVLGATGMIGSVVARRLVEDGHAITAIARDTEKARRTLPPRAVVVRGDVRQPDTLADALSHADAVFFCLSVDPKRGRPRDFNPDSDGLTNVLKLLDGRRDIRIHYVASLLEEHNPHRWWVLDHKAEALRRLEGSGIPFTAFKPSNFMENLAQRNLRGHTIGLIGKARHPNWWIAAEDFARQVSTHLRTVSAGGVPSSNRVFVVQGPEPLTYAEAARRFASAYPGDKLKVSNAPLPVLRIVGRFVPEIAYAVNISEAINNSPETFRADDTWKELGTPTITVEAFARRSTVD